MSIDAIKFPSDTEEPQGIILDDLIRTLREDNSFYQRPVLNSNNEVVLNEIYVTAAKQAGLSQMIVEGPWQENFLVFDPTKRTQLVKNYLFFNDKLSDSFINSDDFHSIIHGYVEACKTLVENRSGIMKMGTIKELVYSNKPNSRDMMTYALLGDLTSPESKQLLASPTKYFHRLLDINSGAGLRSINGIEYKYGQ